MNRIATFALCDKLPHRMKALGYKMMMKQIKRAAVVAAMVLVFLVPVSAHALTVTPVGESYSYTITGNIIPGTIDLQSMPANDGIYANYSFDGGTLSLRNAEIVTGDDKRGFFQHVKPKGVHGHEHYLSVYGKGFIGHPGSATFSFDEKVTTFAFTWGSIDRYNWLEVTNASHDTYKISGADLMASMAGIKEGKTSKYFSITDLSGILTVVLRSCSDAFEVANISVSNVPLPAALPLFGLGLAALVGVRAKKKKAFV